MMYKQLGHVDKCPQHRTMAAQLTPNLAGDQRAHNGVMLQEPHVRSCTTIASHLSYLSCDGKTGAGVLKCWATDVS